MADAASTLLRELSSQLIHHGHWYEAFRLTLAGIAATALLQIIKTMPVSHRQHRHQAKLTQISRLQPNGFCFEPFAELIRPCMLEASYYVRNRVDPSAGLPHGKCFCLHLAAVCPGRWAEAPTYSNRMSANAFADRMFAL